MTQDYSVGYERLCNCLVFLLPVFKKTSLREVLCTVSDIIVDLINILCCCLECYICFGDWFLHQRKTLGFLEFYFIFLFLFKDTFQYIKKRPNGPITMIP
jgi:hypothetical protein